MKRQLLGVAVACGGAALLAIGCSSGPPIVDKDQLAQEVSDQLQAKVGRAPDSVTCAEDLRGEVGVKHRCELQDGPETYGVTVTVTEVDGADVKFDIKVDNKPQ